MVFKAFTLRIQSKDMCIVGWAKNRTHLSNGASYLNLGGTDLICSVLL